MYLNLCVWGRLNARSGLRRVCSDVAGMRYGFAVMAPLLVTLGSAVVEIP
jgi:hypothetical protein